jgi:hypothetical protein
MAAMIKMIATTINNSIKEKPFCLRIKLSLNPPQIPVRSSSGSIEQF